MVFATTMYNYKIYSYLQMASLDIEFMNVAIETAMIKLLQTSHNGIYPLHKYYNHKVRFFKQACICIYAFQ